MLSRSLCLLYKTSKLEYMGSCVDILDDGCLSHMMSDATDMAYILEDKTKEIDLNKFSSQVNAPKFLLDKIENNLQDFVFLQGEDEYKNLVIAYDFEKDMHYFFN